MGGVMAEHPRLLAVVVSLFFAVVFFHAGQVALGAACLAVLAAILGATCFKPESVWAIQEDRRSNERARLLGLFAACLGADGVEIDGRTTMAECIGIYPPCFSLVSSAYGITENRLREVCERSLDAMTACRYDIGRDVIYNGGAAEYTITFYDYDEADVLGEMAVPYADIEHIKPSYKNIPIGKFEDGEIASISLDNRNALIGGLPRSGKSVCLAVLIVGLCRCDNERIIIISPKILDFQAFSSRAELHSEPEDILTALEAVNQEVEMRKHFCEKKGLKKIERFSRRIPHISIIIDEYAVIKAMKTSDEKNQKKQRKIGEEIEGEILRIVAQAAFAGVQVVITSQRLSSQVISTDLRDICAGNLVSFANGSKTSDEMIFGDYSEYAKASQISVRNKGVGYLMKEGEMPRPRLFKGAITDSKTERRIAEETSWKNGMNTSTR